MHIISKLVPWLRSLSYLGSGWSSGEVFFCNLHLQVSDFCILVNNDEVITHESVTLYALRILYLARVCYEHNLPNSHPTFPVSNRFSFFVTPVHAMMIKCLLRPQYFAELVLLF